MTTIELWKLVQQNYTVHMLDTDCTLSANPLKNKKLTIHPSKKVIRRTK